MGIRIQRDIAAPRSDVWLELADLRRHPKWMKDAVSIKFTTGQTEGVGARMEVPTRIGPFRTTDLLIVTEWEPQDTIAVEHKGLVSGSGRFQLKGDSPTTVLWSETLEFPWWLGGRFTALVAAPVLRRIWRQNLRRLAAVIENEKNPT